MAACVNQGCRKTFSDDYVFCPYCGSDNRPLQHRLPAPHHHHEYIQGGVYCWKCGLADPELEERTEGAKRGRNFILLGILAMAVALIFSVVSSGIDASNYERMMEQRRQLEAAGQLNPTSDDDKGPTFQFNPLGLFTYLLGAVGAGLCIYGGITWINSRQERLTLD